MFFLTSTTWYVLLHFRTFSCTSTHKSCYAAGRSLALPHIRHASSCYAAGRSLALPHIRHATLLDVLLHFHKYVMHRHATLLDVPLPKKELFHEALRTQNYSFVVVKH